MRLKKFALNHQVRLYLEDEARLASLPGENPAAKIRDLVHESFAWKAKYDKLLASKQEMEEMYNPSDLPDAWV